MIVSIIPATLDHVPIMLATCRERERAAYEEFTHNRAQEHLCQMIRNSAEAWTGFIDDDLVCLLIISRGSIIGDSVTVWLHTCVAADEHPLVFVRHSQKILAKLRERYHYIYGVVQADNEQSMRWLRWLGFQFDPPEVFNGYWLRKFSMVS
jgi:hypothetical protein